MHSSEAFNAAEKIHNYFRYLHATPQEIEANSGAIRYLRGELQLLLAEVRKLANLTEHPRTHHEAAAIIAWFKIHPLTQTMSAHELNVTVSTDFNRPHLFSGARFKEAMESLGYIRTVNAAGTFYSPPRT